MLIFHRRTPYFVGCGFYSISFSRPPVETCVLPVLMPFIKLPCYCSPRIIYIVPCTYFDALCVFICRCSFSSFIWFSLTILNDSCCKIFIPCVTAPFDAFRHFVLSVFPIFVLNRIVALYMKVFISFSD